MNEIFKPYLRKFTLAFFDDILVYNKSVVKHLMHLKMVLQTMQAHTLFPKRSNYTFAVSQVEYEGHIIYDKGVATYPAKIEAMKDWPVPKNVKQLRGFLGLTSYCNRFIKGYAIISKPLTALLKNNSFKWSSIAQEAFKKLKNAMVQAHVLGLPNFKKEFTVENGSCGTGISVVLQQDGHTLAYLSKALSPKHQAMSTYEKEFLAGSENVVIDALSKKEMHGQLFALIATNVTIKLLKTIEGSWVEDTKLAELLGEKENWRRSLSGSCDYVEDKFHMLLEGHEENSETMEQGPGTLPMFDNDGFLPVFLAAIIDRRLGKMNNKAVVYVLDTTVDEKYLPELAPLLRHSEPSNDDHKRNFCLSKSKNTARKKTWKRAFGVLQEERAILPIHARALRKEGFGLV
ncbi:putative mitochondrial protein [Tanacetum coccineum]